MWRRASFEDSQGISPLERQIYRALHELERRQDVWKSPVVSSWVLDIEVLGMREQLGTWDSAF